MPTVVDIPWPEKKKSQGAQAKYPWDEWFDGQKWLFTPEDLAEFKVKPRSFIQTCRGAARSRKVEIQIMINPPAGPNGVPIVGGVMLRKTGTQKLKPKRPAPQRPTSRVRGKQVGRASEKPAAAASEPAATPPAKQDVPSVLEQLRSPASNLTQQVATKNKINNIDIDATGDASVNIPVGDEPGAAGYRADKQKVEELAAGSDASEEESVPPASPAPSLLNRLVTNPAKPTE